MNEQHLELLRSDGWRSMLAEFLVPFAFGDSSVSELGDDVLEIGPGPGLTTELFAQELGRLTVIELDPELANDLAQKFSSTNVEVFCADATSTAFADGRFSGVVMFTMCHHVPTANLQDQLFREVLRVLRSGGLLVASDSVASPELEALHEDDVYNPVDPDALQSRLTGIGFTDVVVRSNAFGWACHARRPPEGSV